MRVERQHGTVGDQTVSYLINRPRRPPGGVGSKGPGQGVKGSRGFRISAIMSSRVLEKVMAEIVADKTATTQKLNDTYAELSAKLNNKLVGPEPLCAAIVSQRPEMVQAVVDLGMEKDLSSSEMYVAFSTEAPEAVLSVLDAALKHTKIRALMDRLVESSTKAPQHYRRAYARYGKSATAACWKWVVSAEEPWYSAWHAEFAGKVKPIVLTELQIEKIVCILFNDGMWKQRLLDLETRGFALDLESLKRLRSRLCGVPDFHAFVAYRVRKAGNIKAAITKRGVGKK